jgi:hypothetical protein
MRAVSGNCDKMILPIRTFEKYSYSYNDYIHHSSNNAVTVDQYVSFFNKPVSVPHVAVYYSGLSSFPTYDVTGKECCMAISSKKGLKRRLLPVLGHPARSSSTVFGYAAKQRGLEAAMVLVGRCHRQ